MEANARPARRASAATNVDYRLLSLEEYTRAHGETLSAHNNELAEIKTERAVEKERAVHLDQRFDRIEKQLESIQSLGKKVLGAFGMVLVALVANFVFRGGLI